MSQAEQNYKNHARLLPLFHFFVLPVLFANLLYSVGLAWSNPSLGTGLGVLVALALQMIPILARLMALKAQDRVIRLEMRLRLREKLPLDMHSRINELTPEHMIGLRFAGDAELPELVRQALGGTLTTTKSVKEMVKDRQADHLRV